MTDNDMVGYHHQLKEHEFEQTPGDSEGQGSLACCHGISNIRHNLATSNNNKDFYFCIVYLYK